MAMRELNCPTKVVQRDGWVERETQFLVDCYNRKQDQIGKNKIFASKKDFFKAVAASMAEQINSSKTAEQVSSRFYTLTRKPKKVDPPSSDVGTIINISDATTVEPVEAALLLGLDQDSVAFNGQIVFDFDVPDAANSTHIAMPHKPIVRLDGVRKDHLTPSMIESVVGGAGKPFGRDKVESVGMLSAFNRKRLSFPRFSESHRSQHSNIGIATVYNIDTGNINAVKSVSRNPIATGTEEITFGESRSPLERMARISPAKNCTVTSGALNALSPIRTLSSDPVAAHVSYIPRITSVVNSVAVDEEPLRDTQSRSADNDDDYHSSVESNLCASTSGGTSLQSQLSSSDFSLDRAVSNRIVTSVAIHKDPFSAMPTPHTQKSSGTIGRPAIAIQRRQAANNFTSLSARVGNVVDRSSRPIIGNPSKELTSLYQPKKSGKESSAWTNEETTWLLEQYYENKDEIGPLKTFRTKKEMWETLAVYMTENYPAYRTRDDLSKRVQSIINQKKKAVENNRKSGASRVNVEYEDLISKIAAVDDSIEPEVKRDASSVYYKKKSKENIEKPVKKPRWEKPNKKAILNTLSDTMLDIEKRRTEKEKSKEERRKETHSELLELIRVMKK